MSLLIKLFLIITLTLTGIFSVAGLKQFDGTIKIQITHSHEHDHSHDHYQHEGLTDASKHNSTHTERHSHELVVSCAHPMFVEPRSALIGAFESVASHPDSDDVALPRNRALGSIFRPPITLTISQS